MSETPSRQEMFNRAWNGLKSQKWELSKQDTSDPDYDTSMPTCLYKHPTKEQRCAWGWVDTSLSTKVSGTVRTLHRTGVGIAGTLSVEDVEWAQELQRTHDAASSSAAMVANLALFAQKYSLTIPSK